MHALIRGTSTAATVVACARRRLRLEFFLISKCRRPCLRRKSFPVPVTLKRLDTDFLVLEAPGF